MFVHLRKSVSGIKCERKTDKRIYYIIYSRITKLLHKLFVNDLLVRRRRRRLSRFVMIMRCTPLVISKVLIANVKELAAPEADIKREVDPISLRSETRKIQQRRAVAINFGWLFLSARVVFPFARYINITLQHRRHVRNARRRRPNLTPSPAAREKEKKTQRRKQVGTLY